MKNSHALIAILFLISVGSNIYADDRLVPPQLIPQPQNDFEYFFNFRLENFKPDSEPLIKGTFGTVLRLENEEGFWEYNSYTSHAVSFSTNLPSISVIEYGETTGYGRKTVQSDSYYYQHVHYIKGLESNKTYHYRIIVKDFDGNTIESGDYSFTTRNIQTDNVIRIPEDIGGEAPYKLTTPNAKYVLTKDLTVNTLAINIKANDVELDLDGHTIIYDNGTPTVIGDWWNAYTYNEDASLGIRAGLWNLKNIKIFNGTIIQGANGGTGFIGLGFNPILLYHLWGDSYNEIGGVTVDYYGPSVTGMYIDNGYVHHNVVIDRGTVVDNRHQGIKAIEMGSNPENEVSYNSLRRFRHQGVMGAGNKHHNELYSDSYDSNSFLLAAGSGSRIEHNKLFGMGYNPVGTSWATNTVISNNFIYFHGTAPSMRSEEYARLSGIAGLRYTLYDDVSTIYENSIYEDNTVVLKAWKGCTLARGIWTASGERNKGVIYRHNIVKVEALSDEINFTDANTTITCVDINGQDFADKDIQPTPLIFEDNTFIGNVNHITFGSGYGIGNCSRFYGTKFERINHTDAHFAPVRLGYWNWTTKTNFMFDNIPGPGVDPEVMPSFHSYEDGFMEIFYGFTKKVLIKDQCDDRPLRNTNITLTTEDVPSITKKTDNEGFVLLEIPTVKHLKIHKTVTRTDYTSHTIKAQGISDYTISTESLKGSDIITLNNLDCTTKVDPCIDAEPGILIPPQPISGPQNDFEYFFNFRLENFKPDTEPLIKETFGNELKFESEEGYWEYNSYTSHAVGFSTNLPTVSMIEYGETTCYGHETTQSDSYYYQHLHYIKGLKSNTTYHYRVIVQDYDGNKIVSGDHSFTTRNIETDNVIRIPEDIGGEAPYTLTTSNAKYVLTKDFTVNTLAINIKAHNVELDLDGHTIIYDNGTPKVIGTWWNDYTYNEEASFGVRAGLWNFTNVKVFNGTIKQGANGGMGFIGIGFNPLLLYHMGSESYNEVGGVTVDYYGASVSGMYVENGYAHHNVIIDRGTVVDNRHQGIKAMELGPNAANEAAYNSVRRFRHQGIMGSGNKHHNEVYSDSFDSNSFLIAAGKDGKIEHNKMFGMGYNPVGTSWASNTVISNNFIYLHGTAPSMRSAEYQRLSGIAGLRYTLYTGSTEVYENSLYEDNTIVLKAWEGCNLARGIWTSTGDNNKGVIYRRNTVKVEAISDKINFTDVNAAISCVEVHGDDQPVTATLPTPIIFEDNTFIGNVNLIELGSGYGIGGSTRFYRTKLEKINHTDNHFAPIRLGFWYWTTRDNYMFDNIPGPGVDLEQAPTFFGNHEGYMEIFYGFTKKVLITDWCDNSPVRNTDITISSEGLPSITKKTDNDGFVSLELPMVRHLKDHNNISRTNYLWYTFNVQGYTTYSIPTEILKKSEFIILTGSDCNSKPGTNSGEVSSGFFDKNSVYIAPNPTNDYFYITGLKGGEMIHISNASGIVLLTRIAKGDKEIIHVNNFSKGIYFVRITSENAESKTLKLIIE